MDILIEKLEKKDLKEAISIYDNNLKEVDMFLLMNI